MAQQARAVETRALILRAAATVFEERGYGSASLSDVSTAAGVTKGALYFHFDSKESLALAIIEAQHRSSMSVGRALLDQKMPGLRAIITMSQQLAKQLREDVVVRAGIRLTTEASNYSSPIVTPYQEWIVACEEFLRRAIDEGDVTETIDVSVVAHFIIPAFTGVQLVSEVLTRREDIYGRLVEMWLVILPALVPERRWHELRELPAEILLTTTTLVH